MTPTIIGLEICIYEVYTYYYYVMFKTKKTNTKEIKLKHFKLFKQGVAYFVVNFLIVMKRILTDSSGDIFLYLAC